MSQDPDKSGTNEGKSGESENNQLDSSDNAEQSIRKKIRQNAPSPSRSRTPQGKQEVYPKQNIFHHLKQN